jgi:hypothetical protein
MRNARRALSLFMVGLASVISGAANAGTVNNIRVIGVGVQGTQIYLILSAVPPGCPYATLYQSADATGQYIMSLALTARTTGIPLQRADYHRNTSDGPCWVDLLEM